VVHIDEPDAPAARPCGRVLGTEDSTPLEFWVAVAEGSVLQLDDVVALERALPEGELLRIYGVVTQVRARHEGAHFDSDVFLIEEGVLPAEVSESAQVLATRFEPEVFVPPLPGTPVRRAVGAERSEALFFDGMDGSLIPIAVAHGEGYAEFEALAQREAAQPLVTWRFTDNDGNPTELYPLNPNGSPQGIAGLTTADGRFTIVMPHPERVFRTVLNSWHPQEWGEDGPWMRMFRNARRWLG
jgi:hypothetical protein